MKQFRVLCLVLVLVGPIGSCRAIASAQTPAVSSAQRPDIPGPSEPAPLFVRAQGPGSDSTMDFEPFIGGRPIFQLGWDYIVRAGDSVRDVTVIFGNVTVDGTVRGDVVVVLGTVRLSSTALVTGSVVVAGGSATVASGARVRRDLVVVGGALEAAPDFTPGNEFVAIGLAPIGDRVRAVLPWFTQGLLLGRPIVPSLGWVWYVVAGFFLVSLVLNVVFGQAVGACVDVLTRRPLSAFLAGLLTLLLVGPVSLILAVSVVGLAVIPFFICALVIAWTIGKVGVARRLGAGVVQEEDPSNRLQSTRSFVVGFALIALAYMVPVLGFVAWAMVGVVGLGAAVLAFFSAFRREAPPAPPRVVSGPVAGSPHIVPMAAAPAQTSTLGPTEPPAPPAMTDPAGILAFPHASFLDRSAAFALDVLLLLLVHNLLEYRHRDDVFFVLLFAYFVGFWTWKGTTVGGLICQLRLVRVDGTTLRPVDSVVRALSSVFSFAVVGLGCLWILQDAERQAWHDKIAGTYVIKVPRNWPL